MFPGLSLWGLGTVQISRIHVRVPCKTGIEADLLASFRVAARPWIREFPWALTVGSKGGKARLGYPAQTQILPIRHLKKAMGGILHIPS